MVVVAVEDVEFFVFELDDFTYVFEYIAVMGDDDHGVI